MISSGDTNSNSRCLFKEPCPQCGSKDNVGVYDDGHKHCFTPGCSFHTPPTQSDGTPSARTERNPFQSKGTTMQEEGTLQVRGEVVALSARRISEETCAHFGYRVGKYKGAPAQFANYFDPVTRTLLATKVRTKDKQFVLLGEGRDLPLYGQWLWAGGGKNLVITEGEIDALTVSQLQGSRWATVSIPFGAQGAARAIKRNYEWVTSFENVILMFDNDEAGQIATQEVAELLPPGKVKIAHLPCKDANECLVQGKGDAVIKAMWEAKTYRPDGIVSSEDLWDVIKAAPATAVAHYPWGFMDERLSGIRERELVTITSGSGMGKSTLARQIAYKLIMDGHRVGMMMLEESVGRTARDLLSIHLRQKLHKTMEGVDEETLRKAYDDVFGGNNLFLYDHFGSTETGNLLNKMRYMAKALDVKFIILDHVSIVVSGIGDGDERRIIDNLVTQLRTFVEETGVSMFMVSHLKRPEGKGHEEGAVTSLSQLRGSASLGQLSDRVIGLERNQQSDEGDAHTVTVRILKDRFDGETGVAGQLHYDRVTGILSEMPVTCSSPSGTARASSCGGADLNF